MNKATTEASSAQRQSLPSLDPRAGDSTAKQFSVVSYNLLAQHKINRPRFPYCNAKTLRWSHRSEALLDELRDLNADIYCFQDVDKYKAWWLPQLNEMGYDSLFAVRGNSNSENIIEDEDGVAIFFRRDRFQLFRSEFVVVHESLKTEKSQNSKSATVAIVAALQPWEDSDHPSAICVCSAQLCAATSPENAELQSRQMRAVLKTIASVNQDFDLPVVFCGSFNFCPSGSQYYLVTNGRLPEKRLSPRKLSSRPVAEAISRSQIRLSWIAPQCGDAPIESYVIKRRVGGNTVTGFTSELEIANDGPTETTICGLSSGTAYEFTIAARSQVGLGPFSQSSQPEITFMDIANPPIKIHLKVPRRRSSVDGENANEAARLATAAASETDMGGSETDAPSRRSQHVKSSRPRERLVHRLDLSSAYAEHSNAGEPHATICTETERECVDFVFYTKAKLAVVDLLDFPVLSATHTVDPRRRSRLPDVHDNKPGPWSDEQVVSSIRPGSQNIVEIQNSEFMGKYAPRAEQTGTNTHSWLPNMKFASDHFSLRCTFAFDHNQLASAGWH